MIKRLSLMTFCALMLCCGACNKGSQNEPVVVTGKVLLPNGKPAEHATVVLHPVTPTGTETAKPQGKVAADGSFKLKTLKADDGAPPGKYLVTIELWLRSGTGDEPAVNWLPTRYSKPESSGVEVTIAAPQSDVGTIQLTP